MMSIYGRGEETSTGGVEQPPPPERESSLGKKYHNPCRFAGHDHEWRDCPNNYRNKNKRASFVKYQSLNEYKKEGGDVGQGIGKSTSWSQAGGDYYGPASEGGGGKEGGAGSNSEWHDDRDSSAWHDSRDTRGYKPNDNKGLYQDLQMMGSRSKSFGGDGSTHERGNIMDRVGRGFDIENESTSGAMEPNHLERKRHEYNNRQERSNYYSPAPAFKSRASPTAASFPNQHERGYSSNSFASLSVGGPRRGSVQLNPHISAPPFNRSQSYDSQSTRDTKKEHGEEGGDASFYRKLAMSSSFSRRDGMETEHPKTDHKVASPQSHSTGSPPREQEELHRLNSNSSKHEKSLTDDGPVHAKSGSKVLETAEATLSASASSKPQNPSASKVDKASLSLTCAELGAAEKVSKAEEIVCKMNALMKKSLDDTLSSSAGAVRLPSKNEILKCMAVVDEKIKTKDDESVALKKKIKEIEQEKLAEKNRLAKLDREKRQRLIDGVANLKSERRGSIQTKEDDLIKAVDAQKASIQDNVAEELLKLKSKCSDNLKANTAKLKSEISLIKNQVEEAEMTIEEIDVPLECCPEEDDDFAINELDFVPTLDAPGKMASLISSVLEDNQRIAAEAHHETLASIPYFPQSEEDLAATRNSPTSVVTNEEWSNRARKVTGLHDALYSDPSDVPMFKENNESFLELGPQIKERIRVTKKKLKKRWEDLANQYLVRQIAFNEETGVNETSERGGFFSITGRVDESGEIQPLGNVRGNNPYRRPRRGVSPGDVVRSEYEQEQIIAEIAAKEAMEKRIKEGGCALPHQRGALENVRQLSIYTFHSFAYHFLIFNLFH